VGPTGFCPLVVGCLAFETKKAPRPVKVRGFFGSLKALGCQS